MATLEAELFHIKETMWHDFFSKYLSDADSHNGTSKSDTKQWCDNHTIHRQIREDAATENINLGNKMTEAGILKDVRRIIEKDLESDLKYYCIKAVSSFIKRDNERFYWNNLVKKELKNIERTVSKKYIQLYIANIIPIPSQKILLHLFENKLQSKLKDYLELRKHVPPIKQECLNALIHDEWNRIRREGVSEKFICLYCFISVGINSYWIERSDE